MSAACFTALTSELYSPTPLFGKLPEGSINFWAAAKTPAQHQQRLQSVTSWEMEGRIAFIRPQERHSASIQWHERINHVQREIWLNTVIGVSIAHLKSENGQSYALEFDGKTYQTDDPEAFLAARGASFPNLKSPRWLLGETQDFDSTTMKPNQPHLIQSGIFTNQSGVQWQVNYHQYKTYRGLELPSSIQLESPDYKIKLKVHTWNF